MDMTTHGETMNPVELLIDFVVIFGIMMFVHFVL